MKRIVITFLLIALNASINAQQVLVKQWDRRFGGANDEYFWALKASFDGGCILGGRSTSGVSGDKTQPCWGVEDYWVVKLDLAGNKEWDKRFGPIQGAALTVLQPAADGGYILGGYSGGSISGDKTEAGRGGFDYWVVKIDATGNKQWDKRFGGSGDDLLWCMANTKDGGYILGGRSNSGLNGDKTEDNRDSNNFYSDYWVVKIDSTGLKQWDKRFGGSDDDDLLSIQQTTDGGYILGGLSYSRTGGDKTQDNWDTTNPLTPDYWVVKIDSVGHKEWDKRFGTITSDGVYTILEMPNSGYIIFGGGGVGINGDKTIEKGGWWVIKTDALGKKVSENVYAGQAYGKSMVQTSDGGYLMSGDALYLASMDSSIFDKTELNQGSQNTWVIKVDSNGLKQWDKTIFTTGADNNGLAIQTADGCYAVANTSKSGIGGYKTQAAWDSSYDYFIVKFCMDTVTAIDDRHETQDTRQIQVYPNPFNSDLSIALKGENIQEATFTITNALGQVIYKREESNLSSNYTKMLDLSYLPCGFYFIQVTANGESTVKRVVKE